MEKALFEPLETADLMWLPFKTALLLALASAKRVGELQALSVHQDLCRFLPEGAGMHLNPAFLPKVTSSWHSNQAMELRSLSSTQKEGSGRELSLVSPVRALRVYMCRTQAHRNTDQLFVCFKPGRFGQPLSKAPLSHWIGEAIHHAYVGTGTPFPPGIRGHSTRGMAASWALWRGASLAEVCAAATWSAPATFARFYQLNVATSTPFGERVLGAARQQCHFSLLCYFPC